MPQKPIDALDAPPGYRAADQTVSGFCAECAGYPNCQTHPNGRGLRCQACSRPDGREVRFIHAPKSQNPKPQGETTMPPKPKTPRPPNRATKKPLGTLILCKTDADAHDACRKLAAAGFRAGGSYDECRIADGAGQLLLVGSSMETDDPTRFHAHPCFDGISFSHDFQVPVSRILAAEGLTAEKIARLAAAAGLKPRNAKISRATLVGAGACEEGLEWFADTFGCAAAVSRSALVAALQNDGYTGWLVWLDANLPV